jgi:hypothetical protein
MQPFTPVAKIEMALWGEARKWPWPAALLEEIIAEKRTGHHPMPAPTSSAARTIAIAPPIERSREGPAP